MTVVVAVTDCMSPTLAEALSSRNHGSTAMSAISSPAPSSPSRSLWAMRTSSAVIGHESLPRSPSPSKPATTVSPAVPERTSHSDIGPAAASGRLDHT